MEGKGLPLLTLNGKSSSGQSLMSLGEGDVFICFCLKNTKHVVDRILEKN